MSILYDFEKETDKEFLRAAGKLLQDRVISFEMEIFQLKKALAIEEEIKNKLTCELIKLKKIVFDNRQERKNNAKLNKKKKRKQGINLPHNENENKKEIDKKNDDLELDSKEITHDLDNKDCPCCGKSSSLSEIQNLFEESSEIDINETLYLLKIHKRKKFKCKNCNKMVTAPGPTKLAPGGTFSIQMGAKVATDKFEHHIPLERQRKMMLNAGLKISVKTLYSLTAHIYNILSQRIMTQIREDIIDNGWGHMDESPMPYYKSKKEKGFVWSLSNNKGVIYQFEETRSGSVAKELISGFKGVVTTDAYTGYDFLDKEPNIIHSLCWAHVRRYFFEAMTDNKAAGDVVDYIDELYDIEHEANDLDDLAHLREKKSTIVVNDIRDWVKENESKYPSTSSLTGKAIKYFLNNEERLLHFLANKNCPFDNNCSERKQRSPVMGRKNYQAFRSVDGADVAMFHYSVVESCKINGLKAYPYIVEMTIKAQNNEEVISPYRYACKLKESIKNNLINNLKEIKGNPPS